MVDLYQETVPVDSPNVRAVPVAVQIFAAAVVNVPTEEAELTLTLTANEFTEHAPLVNTALYQVSCVNASVVKVWTPLVDEVAAITSPTFSNPSVAEVADFCHWIFPTDAVAKLKVALDPIHIAAGLAVITLASGTGTTVNNPET